MKTHLLINIILLITTTSSFAQHTKIEIPISINSSGTAPDHSAVLDIESTTKGILIPSMTEQERNSIFWPAKGLLVFQIDGRKGFWYNKGQGSTSLWKFLEAEGHYIIDQDADTEISVESTPDEDQVTMKIQNNDALVISHDGENSKLETKSINGNTLIGNNTANLLITGQRNTTYGSNVLFSASISEDNTSMGSESMALMVPISIDEGAQNTAFGESSLKVNTTGNNHVAIGTKSLFSNTTGGDNTAVGYNSLMNNTSGSTNVAAGYNSLHSLSSGNNNIGLGYAAGRNLSMGNDNIFLGSESAPTLENGDSNIAIGQRALSPLTGTPSTNNIAIGVEALMSTSAIMYGNTAIGNQAGWASKSFHTVYLGTQAGILNIRNHRIFIQNGTIADPLVLGKFDDKTLEINAVLKLKPLVTPPTCSDPIHEGSLYNDAVSNSLQICTLSTNGFTWTAVTN